MKISPVGHRSITPNSSPTNFSLPHTGCRVSPTRGVVAQHYVPWQLVPWDYWSPSPETTKRWRRVRCPVGPNGKGAVSVILRGEDVVEYLYIYIYMIYRVYNPGPSMMCMFLYARVFFFTCFRITFRNMCQMQDLTQNKGINKDLLTKHQGSNNLPVRMPKYTWG